MSTGPEERRQGPTPEGALLRVAEVMVGAARAVSRALPARVKRRIDDGIFHYIFQKTRVENDAYGWRPTTPGGGEPPPGVRKEPR